MFSAQPNNDTRTYEYPWAYFAGSLSPRMRVLEIGGALSGFQFVLSAEGHEVDNVDPGIETFGPSVDQESIARMNRVFGTSVTLHNCRIENAPIPGAAYDRVFALSVLEHLPPDALPVVMDKIGSCLKPGGLLILTIDLFLDLVPFSRRSENRWGCNLPLSRLLNRDGYEMVHGVQSELYGCPGFDPQEILANLADYYIGRGYPALVQTAVVRRL